MPVIKRYANRKLYDSDSKRYVTLEDLAEFIRRGEDVRVVDHVTGEDLTSITLMQVIFEEEKKIGGLLPQVFLTRLIRAGGSTLNALRSRMVSLDPFKTVDEEIRYRIQGLVEQGKLAQEEAARLQELLMHHPSQPEAVSIPVKGEEEENAVPVGSRVYPESPVEPEPADPQELEALLMQVDALEKELQRLKQSKQTAE